MPPFELSGQFRRPVIGIHGKAGAEWLDDFPLQLGIFSEHWDLALGPAFDLSFNFVTPAIAVAEQLRGLA